MTAQEILYLRIHNQLLAGNAMTEPHEVVAYMGAMQSQAFDMARWAIGVRIPGITDREVTAAINSAQIIRIHILRPTWHFVAAEDIHWMLDLSTPRLKPVYDSYRKMTGIDDSILSKTICRIENILSGDKHLTNNEIADSLCAAGVSVNTDMVNVLLRHAELEGLICNGRVSGSRQTFCLLEEMVSRKGYLSKEESLEKLARRFFTSHAPASVEDFTWWSGLSATDAKKGLGLVKDDFVSEDINDRKLWMKNDIRIPKANDDPVLLLPQFDEFVVSYKNRSELIDDKYYGKVMTKNGLFSPTIMLDGRIIGSWKKIRKGGRVEVEPAFFENISKQIADKFKRAENRFLDYMQ